MVIADRHDRRRGQADPQGALKPRRQMGAVAPADEIERQVRRWLSIRSDAAISFTNTYAADKAPEQTLVDLTDLTWVPDQTYLVDTHRLPNTAPGTNRDGSWWNGAWPHRTESRAGIDHLHPS